MKIIDREFKIERGQNLRYVKKNKIFWIQLFIVNQLIAIYNTKTSKHILPKTPNNLYSPQTNSKPMHQNPQQSLRPQYYYHYKSDSQSIILDTQYNQEGSILALSNSQGYILLYHAQGDDVAKEPYFIYSQESKKELKNNAIIKIVWSPPQLGLLASCSIYQHVTLYKFKGKTFTFLREIQADCIPVYLAFYPSQFECLLTVAFSDGSIRLYNSDLQLLQNVQAHNQVVNCIAWDSNFYKLQKNKWVESNFTNLHKTAGKTSYLLSCSSDCTIKIWKWAHNKLKLLGTQQKAHEKHIRMVAWKAHFFNDSESIFASCSQDHTVKIWSIKILQNKCQFTLKGSTNMKGPVYKAKYNLIGSLLAVSYCNEDQEKVETKIFKEINGTLCQQLKIQN